MARPTKFSTEQILDGALAVVGRRWRAATIADVGAQIGAPVGSIYHRFGSREELFVALWLRSIRRFHVGFLAATEGPDARRAAVAAAVHIPRYCRRYPAEALALSLYRWEALIEDGPADLIDEIGTVNDDVEAALRRLCADRFGSTDPRHLELLSVAVQACPYGLVRPYLGAEVPAALDDIVAAASGAILDLGDTGEVTDA
ncbi:TetR/AcrR family transcriptional regulator [Millisia brevis]|uniref:TetR/AcrR family transcriptional regulator n=1 Tax=Millisia brevis TaxID=264148 RepID=UPI0008351A99|nr:TetR/AcrR family transcriptional regulator [Millisia brevis]